MQLLIKDRTKASKILLSPSKGKDVTHILSFHNIYGNDNSVYPACGFHSHPAVKLRFAMEDDDIETKAGPKMTDVEAIVDFAKKIQDHIAQGKECKLLSQCYAGKNRSTAGAFIILCFLLGPGKEAEALARVREAAPKADPNYRLVLLADDFLKRNGAMLKALEVIPKRRILENSILP